MFSCFVVYECVWDDMQRSSAEQREYIEVRQQPIPHYSSRKQCPSFDCTHAQAIPLPPPPFLPPPADSIAEAQSEGDALAK